MTLAEFLPVAERFWRSMGSKPEGLEAFLDSWSRQSPATRQGFVAFIKSLRAALRHCHVAHQEMLDRITDEKAKTELLAFLSWDVTQEWDGLRYSEAMRAFRLQERPEIVEASMGLRQAHVVGTDGEPG